MFELLASYYEVVAKVSYGAKHLVEKDVKQELIDRYNAHLNNISVLHSKIKELKKKNGLPMFNFNNVKEESIHIENGFLVGNIEMGRVDAYSLVSNFDHNEPISEKSLRDYELGLLVLNLSSKVKESYIAPKSELAKIEQNENRTISKENIVLSEITVDTLSKEKKDNKTQKEKGKKKDVPTSNVMQFSMF